MNANTPPKAPTGIGPEALRFWHDVTTEYQLSPWQYGVLETACTSKDMEARCIAILNAEGMTIATGQGMIRARPEATLLRDARASFLRACKDLNLEVDE